MARDEHNLRENMVKGLEEATNESNKVFEAISISIESVRKSIGDGLSLLANAIGGWNQQSQLFNTSTPVNYRMRIPQPFTAFPDNFQQAQNNTENFENKEPRYQNLLIRNSKFIYMKTNIREQKALTHFKSMFHLCIN